MSHIARRIEKNDLEDIYLWNDKWGLEFLSPLPAIGFRTKNAACFVIRAECEVAIIEHLIRNPDSDPAQVDDELDLVVRACMLWSKENGFEHVWALSDIKDVTRRAERLGFKIQKINFLSRRF